MDDATRRTWAGVFLTLGSTMLLGTFIRWARWHDAGALGPHPQVLWALGFSAIGLLLVSVQLWLPVWARERSERREHRMEQQARNDASGGYWSGE